MVEPIRIRQENGEDPRWRGNVAIYPVFASPSIVDIIIIMAGTISWNIGAGKPANKHVRAGQDKLFVPHRASDAVRPTLKRGTLEQLIQQRTR